MNFFDTYDIARAPTPQPSDENQPSLNDEFNQVVGQLGRFWGGFKRQSQQVLEVAKKDLGDVVVQAQKEIGKLTAVDESQPEASTSTTTPRSGPAAPDVSAAEGDSTPSKEDAAEASSSSAEGPSHTRSDSSSTTSLFSRLQSAIPPNLVSTVQSHIPESIKHASENIDLAQLSTNLKTEFQRVQGITRAQAEEYARKSEALIREAVKEANEVLKDAVKIIPPDGQGVQASESGMIWDGTDMWMLPTEPSTGSGKERESGSGRQSFDTQTAVASRALALLHRLQSDPVIVQRDPEAEEGVRDEYKKWVEEEIKAKGGIESADWSEKTGSLLKEETALYELYTGLVPSTLSKEEFWSRYFFRAHQIKAEEERRKALIQASVAESDEDFSWEDDEDENATSPTSESQASPSTTAEKEKPSAISSTTSSQKLAVRDAPSPRVGSSDSFDVVSSTTTSVAGDTVKPAAKKEKSDDEVDEGDTDDDEEESDSDWE